MDNVELSQEALEFSRKRGPRASVCLDCGGEPMPTRRYCASCRAAREKAARLLRREKNASKPCAVDGCLNPRRVTDSQTSAYCLEHKNEKAGVYRKKARTPERFEERPCEAEGCPNVFMWGSTHAKQRFCSRECREAGQLQDRQKIRDQRTRAQFLENSRLCISCREVKNIDAFPPRWQKSKDGLGTCRDCVRIYQERHREKNIDLIRKRDREARQRAYRKKYLEKYGISFDDFRALVESQQGRCAICQKEQPLQPDHCHVSGKYRGAICGKCNRAIGLLGDDLESVSRAVAYLQAVTDAEEGAS
jgi:hypothetical protein